MRRALAFALFLCLCAPGLAAPPDTTVILYDRIHDMAADATPAPKPPPNRRRHILGILGPRPPLATPSPTPTPMTDPREAVCSGFILQNLSTGVELIVTAKHCVLDQDGDDLLLHPDTVRYFDGEVARVVGSWFAIDRDVAIVAVRPVRHHPAATMRRGGLVFGESLFPFGMPQGFAWTMGVAYASNGDLALSQMYLSADMLSDDAAYSFLLWSDCRQIQCLGCGPGSSGGPVYDKNGNVVGTVVAGGGSSVLIVPESDIEAFWLETLPKALLL